MKITPDPRFKVVAFVYESKDYKFFDMAGCNRKIHNSPKLLASMKAHGFMNSKPAQAVETSPNKFGIVAGNNRFANSKKLGIPFKFVIDDAVTDIYVLEGDSKGAWRTSEFADARVRDGDDHVTYVTDFQAKHHLSLSSAAMLLDDGTRSQHGAMRHIKDGSFTVSEASAASAERVVYITDLLYDKGVKFAVSTSFVAAVAAALAVAGVSYHQLVDKARKHYHTLKRKTTIPECLAEVEALYNRGAGKDKKLPIVFYAGDLTKK